MKPDMRKLIAEIPEDVFRALKVRASETDNLMRDVVEEALRQYLGMGAREGATKTKK